MVEDRPLPKAENGENFKEFIAGIMADVLQDQQ